MPGFLLLRRRHAVGVGGACHVADDDGAAATHRAPRGQSAVPGQAKAGQAKAGQAKAGQGRTGQDRTGQDRTGQDKAGQGRTRQDKAGQGRTRQAARRCRLRRICRVRGLQAPGRRSDTPRGGKRYGRCFPWRRRHRRRRRASDRRGRESHNQCRRPPA